MEKKVKFSKNFFTKIRQHATKEDKIDNISYKWPKSVMDGNEKAILYSTIYEKKKY